MNEPTLLDDLEPKEGEAMTTRELLRAVAHDLERLVDRGQAPRGWEIATEQIAALRAIADRFDAEMARAAALGSWGTGQQEALARLDAPVTKDG